MKLCIWEHTGATWLAFPTETRNGRQSTLHIPTETTKAYLIVTRAEKSQWLKQPLWTDRKRPRQGVRTTRLEIWTASAAIKNLSGNAPGICFHVS